VLLIYTNHITLRLQYITKTLLGDAVELTTNKEQFIQSSDTKINYATERICTEEFFIQPHALLFQTNITQQNVECFEWNGLTAFFRTAGDIPFDIFAASFYLLSRYEEYLPHEKDEYGRYAYQNSMAYKESFLHLPLVNLWLKKMAEGIKLKAECLMQDGNKDAAFSLQPSAFRFLPTYDIDIAYAYQHQPIWKNVLGFYRDLLRADFDKVTERANVYGGKNKDPFNVFDWLDELHNIYNLQPIYFLLTIIERGLYDKNLKISSSALQQLYRKLAAKYTIGIHPSWKSGVESRELGVRSEEGSQQPTADSRVIEENSLLRQEISALQNVVQSFVTKSRQHYLRFTIPATFRKLIAFGIKEEYSMGYGTINGFRASYCKPFYWYDLENEIITSLQLHPFCFMDANAYFEQKYTAEEAAAELQQLYDVVKFVNGEMICLFHNHFLTEQPQWIGWRKMYATFLKTNSH